MRLAIFELLGYILDRIDDFQCLDLFLSFDNDDIIIEFSNTRLIEKLILPLCDKSYTDFLKKSNWYTARLVFSDNAINSVVLENHLGECFSSDVREMIQNYITDKELFEQYCELCSDIAEYVTFLLTM